VGFDESLAREIARRVLKVASLDKIILFGSAAPGTMNRDSGIALPPDIIPIFVQWCEESKHVISSPGYPDHQRRMVIGTSLRTSNESQFRVDNGHFKSF
jgi:hypothetical protein